MALPILPDLYGKVEQKIDTFTFRNEGAIKIPKERREIAYKQAVDIFIDSIDFNLYQNNKSAPPLQFYGYATLVFEDAISQSIPLIFPRQRLIDVNNWEAFRQWNELAVFWEHWQFHRWNEIKILQIQGALEIPDIVDFSPQFGDTKFLELPLREVFVQVQPNCQFRIEYSQYQPIPYTDPFGNVRNGKSDQSDGEKDGGLPSGGIQPKQNSPSNPFGGSRPSEGIPTIENGFLVDDGKLTLELDSDRLNRPATETQEGYYWQIFWKTTTSSTECTNSPVSVYIPSEATTRFNREFIRTLNNTCPQGREENLQIISTSDNSVFYTRLSFLSDGNAVGFFNYGILPFPANTVVFG